MPTPKKIPEGERRVSMNISEELYIWYKDLAERDARTVKYHFTRALIEYRERQDKQK